METTSQKLLNSINIGSDVTKYPLSSDDEVIQCALVRGRHLKPKYEDWVQHSKPCVRKLIAETYPEYVPLLPCETDWELITVGNYLLEQVKPKLDVLEKFLAKIEPLQNHDRKALALQLKYETLTREMTAIEKTMSLKQLWQSDSPFWAEKLSGRKVVDIIRAYSLSEKSREEFDIESVYNIVEAPFYQRLNGYTTAVAKLEKILNEVPNDSTF